MLHYRCTVIHKWKLRKRGFLCYKSLRLKHFNSFYLIWNSNTCNFQAINAFRVYIYIDPRCFFVCLFGVFRSTYLFLYEDVTGCKFWPMLGTYGHWAVEVFFVCHTYSNTEHPFIMVISEDPWHSHLLPGIWQWTWPFLF